MQLVELDISRNGKVRAQWGNRCPTVLLLCILHCCVHFCAESQNSSQSCRVICRGSGAVKICVFYCVSGCHQYLVSHFPHDGFSSSLFFFFFFFPQTFQKFLKASNSANPWRSQTSVGIPSPGREGVCSLFVQLRMRVEVPHPA